MKDLKKVTVSLKFPGTLTLKEKFLLSAVAANTCCFVSWEDEGEEGVSIKPDLIDIMATIEADTAPRPVMVTNFLRSETLLFVGVR